MSYQNHEVARIFFLLKDFRSLNSQSKVFQVTLSFILSRSAVF